MADRISSPDAARSASIQERRKALIETTTELVAAGEGSALGLILNSQLSADLAELIPHLAEDEQGSVFESLAEPLAAEVLAELDVPEMLSITGELDDAALTDLVGDMAPDDAADVLGELPAEQSASVLELMEDDEAEAVRELLAHDENTAGGIMTSNLIAVREDMTVADAVAHIRAWADEDEILYIYVVDTRKRLLGTVPLRRLILSAPETRIAELTDREPITVPIDLDQEEIARIVTEYDLLAVPVVDAVGELLGRVTVDDVVQVIAEEATEDMYVMAATSSQELEERSVFGVVRRRLPWLLVCLAGTLVSGSMIELYAPIISQVGALLLFVPAIMAMGGNTGIQAATVTVRSLATGQLQAGGVIGTVFRELRIAVLMGSVLGILVFAVGQAWTGAQMVGACVGLAMFSAVVFSAVMGAVIPLFFRAIGVDPAVASGPLITTLNDALSLVIYFTVATVLLQVSV
jgi:magnesium transporter